MRERMETEEEEKKERAMCFLLKGERDDEKWLGECCGGFAENGFASKPFEALLMMAHIFEARFFFVFIP